MKPDGTNSDGASRARNPQSRNPQEQGLREQIDEVGRRSERRFEPGMRAVWIAVAVLVLLIAATLPWVEHTPGWQVLFGELTTAKVAGIAPRVFLAIAFLFGVLGSVVALLVRRYVAAWVCSLGADLSILFGILSIWSQQTTSSHAAGPGPGPGLVLAVVAVVALAVLWGGIAWKKPPLPPRETPAERLPDDGTRGTDDADGQQRST